MSEIEIIKNCNLEDIDNYINGGICIVCNEDYNQVNELYPLITKGKEMAEQIHKKLTILFINNITEEEAKKFIYYGVDYVFIENCGENNILTEQEQVDIIDDFIKKMKSSIVLFNSSLCGKSVAARLSVRLKTGLTADCIDLEIDKVSKLLLQKRTAMGESAKATIVCEKTKPQMATVRKNIFKIGPLDYSRKGTITYLNSLKQENKSLNEKILKICNEINKDDSLKKREIVVAGGNGLKEKENLKYLFRFAELLNGEVGVTRPLVDCGWADYKNQIGQTGKIVSPKLYFAFGISGAIQHVVGMAASDICIAVNTDPEAPIFKEADYGLVGDAVETLQCLIRYFENKKQ